MSRQKIWTCVLEFRGGTYVRQVWSASPQKVLGLVFRRIAGNEVRYLGSKALKRLIHRLDKDGGDPVPIQCLSGVFCATAPVGKHLMMAHIIETSVAPSQRPIGSPVAIAGKCGE